MISRRSINKGLVASALCPAMPARAWPAHGAAGNAPQVQQFFNRLISLPSASRQSLYANLINALVSDGTWAALDVLVVPAAADAGTALTELVSGITVPQLVSSPTFTVDRGFAFANSSVIYVNTNFIPFSSGVNFSQNSAFIGAWNLGTAQANSPFLRTSADVSTEIWPAYNLPPVSTLTMLNNSGSTENASVNSADASGWFAVNRSTSNALTTSRNNVQIGTFSTVSTTPENLSLLVGFGGAPTGWGCAAYAFGKALTSGQQTTLYNALQTYLHAVGAV